MFGFFQYFLLVKQCNKMDSCVQCVIFFFPSLMVSGRQKQFIIIRRKRKQKATPAGGLTWSCRQWVWVPSFPKAFLPSGSLPFRLWPSQKHLWRDCELTPSSCFGFVGCWFSFLFCCCCCRCKGIFGLKNLLLSKFSASFLLSTLPGLSYSGSVWS